MVKGPVTPLPVPSASEFNDALSLPDDALLRRDQASRFLNLIGAPVAKQTLAKIACTCSDGPPMIYMGRVPFYRVGDLRSWATARQRRRRSTADTGVPIAFATVGGDNDETQMHCPSKAAS